MEGSKQRQTTKIKHAEAYVGVRKTANDINKTIDRLKKRGLTAFTIAASKAHGAIAFVGVESPDATSAILAWSDHLAQIGFDLAVLPAETFFALASVVGQTSASLRTETAVGAGLPLASAGSSAILHVGRVDDGIDQV